MWVIRQGRQHRAVIDLFLAFERVFMSRLIFAAVSCGHRLAVRFDIMGTIQKLFYGRGTKRKGEAHEWLVDSGDNCNLVLASGIHFA